MANMPPSPTSPQSPYGGKGPLILIVSWIEAVIATILIAARVYSSLKLVHGTAWPTAWAVFGWVCGVLNISFLTVALMYGLGNHIFLLEPPDIIQSLKYSWAAQAVAIFNLGIAKVVVISFLLQIQGQTYPRVRQFLFFLAISNVVISIIEPILSLTQCTPAAKLWDINLPGECTRVAVGRKFAWFQSAWNSVTDFYLAVWPFFFIRKLQMPLRLKAGLCILLGLGVFMGIISIVKAIEIQTLNNTLDPTYAIYPLLLWMSTELWVTLIISSIPPLWPLISRSYMAVSHSYLSRFGSSTGASSSADRSTKPDTVLGAPAPRSSRAGFATLDSRAGSRDPIVPPRDAIVMTKDFGVHADVRGAGSPGVALGGAPFESHELNGLYEARTEVQAKGSQV